MQGFKAIFGGASEQRRHLKATRDEIRGFRKDIRQCNARIRDYNFSKLMVEKKEDALSVANGKETRLGADDPLILARAMAGYSAYRASAGVYHKHSDSESCRGYSQMPDSVKEAIGKDSWTFRQELDYRAGVAAKRLAALFPVVGAAIGYLIAKLGASPMIAVNCGLAGAAGYLGGLLAYMSRRNKGLEKICDFYTNEGKEIMARQKAEQELEKQKMESCMQKQAAIQAHFGERRKK